MQDVEQPTCVICAGECRGHSLGHSDQWKPEAGSRVAVMQDVERVARALCEASGRNPDGITPAPRGVRGMVPLWTLWEKQATAAISAMTPTEPHLEFRPDENGEFDEMVARFSDGTVHVETMSDKRCYVAFRWNDGRFCQWYISSGKALKYHHEQGNDTGNLAPTDQKPIK